MSLDLLRILGQLGAAGGDAGTPRAVRNAQFMSILLALPHMIYSWPGDRKCIVSRRSTAAPRLVLALTPSGNRAQTRI